MSQLRLWVCSKGRLIVLLRNVFSVAHSDTVSNGESGFLFDLQLFSDGFADDFVDAGDEGTIIGGSEVDSPELYDISLPEGAVVDEVSLSEFSALAGKIGLSGEAANELASYGFSFAQKAQEAVLKERQEEIRSWGECAKRELGARFDDVVSSAGAGIEVLERQIPGIRAALNETGAGNRVEIIRAIAYLGDLVKEDGGRGLGGAMGASTGKSMYPNTNFDKY